MASESARYFDVSKVRIGPDGVLHADGRACIALDGAPSLGRNVTDMDSLDD
jgi:hypothetical protein